MVPAAPETEGEEDQMARLLAEREHLTEVDGNVRSPFIEKPKKNGSLQNTSTDSKEAIFVILVNHADASVRKIKLSPTNKEKKRLDEGSA